MSPETFSVTVETFGNVPDFNQDQLAELRKKAVQVMWKNWSEVLNNILGSPYFKLKYSIFSFFFLFFFACMHAGFRPCGAYDWECGDTAGVCKSGLLRVRVGETSLLTGQPGGNWPLRLEWVPGDDDQRWEKYSHKKTTTPTIRNKKWITFNRVCIFKDFLNTKVTSMCF